MPRVLNRHVRQSLDPIVRILTRTISHFGNDARDGPVVPAGRLQVLEIELLSAELGLADRMSNEQFCKRAIDDVQLQFGRSDVIGRGIGAIGRMKRLLRIMFQRADRVLHRSCCIGWKWCRILKVVLVNFGHATV